MLVHVILRKIQQFLSETQENVVYLGNRNWFMKLLGLQTTAGVPKLLSNKEDLTDESGIRSWTLLCTLQKMNDLCKESLNIVNNQT